MGFPNISLSVSGSNLDDGPNPQRIEIRPSEAHPEDHIIHEELRVLFPGLQSSVLLLGVREDVRENSYHRSSDSFERPRNLEGCPDFGSYPVLPLSFIIDEPEPDKPDKQH